MANVLIIGGGFAGVEAAIRLKKYGFQVLLISQQEYLYIFPISIWIPTDGIDAEKCTIPLSKIAKRWQFDWRQDSMIGIDPEQKRVQGKNDSYEYDFLVLALGAGKVEHSGSDNFYSICNGLQTAQQMRQAFAACVAKKEGSIAIGFGGNAKDSSAVRGGPAFELLLNIDHYLRKNKLRQKFSLNFFAPMPEPGARMGAGALAAMDNMLSKLQIGKFVGKKIKEFQTKGIVFEDQSQLASDLTFFIPANAGHPALRNSILPLNEAGFVRIDDHGQVVGYPEIYAAGDVAAIQGPPWRAKQGHIAVVMARNAAFNIHQQQQGKPKRRGYQKHINILCIMDSGNSAAVVYRDAKRAKFVPLPIVGHWLKKAWGLHYRLSILGKLPKLPGI